MDRLVVSPQDASKRLDIFVAEHTGRTRSQVQRLIRDGCVLVNRSREPQNYRVRPPDLIEVKYPETETDALIPEPIPVTILYRDEHLVVVDKPPGMVVYPA